MILLYLFTLVPFLILDAIMLTTFLAPAFVAQAGPLMAATPVLLPAVAYLAYPAGIVALITGPALTAPAPPPWPRAALLGALAYGTHELTNWSVLAGYPANLALIDTLWGAVLTAVSATLGLALARRLRQLWPRQRSL